MLLFTENVSSGIPNFLPPADCKVLNVTPILADIPFVNILRLHRQSCAREGWDETYLGLDLSIAPVVLSSTASRDEMVAGISLEWWKSSTAEPTVMGNLRSKTMI
jgi:hypothetical protein